MDGHNTPKRFYWLKLKQDFFSQLPIMYLESLEDGEKKELVYLHMMLMSVSTGGFIPFCGVGNDITEEIALAIRKPIGLVKDTIAALEHVKLIEFQESNCFLPEVAQCTGSEGASAQRMRKLREEKSKMSQCDTTITSQCDDRDKRKEKREKNINICSFDNERVSAKSVSKEKKPEESAALCSFFTEAWEAYPRKMGKRNVTKKALKELAAAGRDTVMRAIELYKRKNADTDEKYLLYGSSFFNGGWKDYIAETRPEQKRSTPVIDMETRKLQNALAKLTDEQREKFLSDGILYQDDGVLRIEYGKVWDDQDARDTLKEVGAIA